MLSKYDYLIVGAGLYGAVFAREATQRGKTCMVIDKRSHTGGNVYCKNTDGINVHKYGAHIFHTSNKQVWEYVNSFVEFNRYTNSPIANYKGKLYNLPFNMNTFYQLWGVTTACQAKAKIEEQRLASGIKDPANLEEQAISLVGKDIYEVLIKGYTEKQWGRKATELPAFIIKRLPVRFTFDNNYFNDKYQGIPIGGYNKLIEGLLEGVEVKLNTDYFADKAYFDSLAGKVVFTGKIDEFFGYCFGKLAYRSLRFEEETLDADDFQSNAVVNYTDAEMPYTRIIEHKYFENVASPKTVITREYPQEWNEMKEPYYPVNDSRNETLYSKYKQLTASTPNVIFGGRLAEFKYYDMHQVIEKALQSSHTQH
jgi:UDP-galactopyranose mutase